MSLTHESRVLELESQTELLERLQLLTNFGSNLVTVGGEIGAGKSWLAQRYLEAWAQDKNQSLLMCHPNQDDSQRRSTILNQIISNSLFSPQDSLVDSLEQILEGEPCDLVIVVDDAHLLTESFISELWMLVLEAQSNPHWSINVVLFAKSNSIEGLLTRLSYGQEHKPIELEVDSLRSEEAERFFEFLVIRYVDDNLEKRVRQVYKKTPPLPGAIMALGDHKVEKRIIIRSIVGSPGKIAALIILLLLIIGGGYYWMISQPSPDEKAQQITDSLEQTVIPTLPSVSSSVTTMDGELVTNENQGGAELVDPSYQGAIDDSMSLPPDVVDETASVGLADDDQQRVVINSDVVDALLDDKPADTSTIDNAITDAQQQADEGVEAESVIEAESAPSEKIITFSFSREALKAFSPRSYTLQLAAMNSLTEVQEFIEQYAIEDQVRVYPTMRNDIEWYIVTYENYPTIQVARDAVDTLPEALRELGPWAKSMSQVHREIDREK
ncbi:AAA family ATPase [Vibrio genomosp. F10]|uniref:Cell division protein DamX n=2 Tax=Vibrio genomosp. F10 TaxID=723171 RepID=A0A1B9R1C8_9VIBR|nr:AAA family ATPase [Vibrio genomosp. F10]OCH78073.1 cell division protein DamX [Vibrio genomosp. F10]OEE37565.1 cell division protein DamX [Vibrio genomosp. F10 str. ZF-129]OEE86548.1 cell division protein DamX [Vibrio genomosp. F10 str. 9ZD137]OEE94706.1 cell division protein DamX [Vibrio genomosp. F10 str. 9ZC157]OEF05272.1 cell division protein DamX [Vibrio genomosp. F10 str. 9ZB36]